MYIVCPDCGNVSWIPMGNGTEVEYKESLSDIKVISPIIILDIKKISWKCDCYSKRSKNLKKTTENTSNKD